MTELLARLKIFPDFARFLDAFGSKTFAKDEAYSGCRVSCSLDDGSQPHILGEPPSLAPMVEQPANGF